MVFTDVFEEGHVEEELKKKHGVEFAEVPFNDGHGQTAYWISRDGAHAYVGTVFGGWYKCKEIRIYPARYRSPSSAPCFKRRNGKGTQTIVSVPVAVYGTFVLKDCLPKFRIGFKDGNIENCNLDNLKMADDSEMKENLKIFSDVYRRHKELVRTLRKIVYRISFEDLEDIVSDAFLRVCLCRVPIEPDRVFGLWFQFAYELSITRKERNRLRYMGTYEAIDWYFHSRDEWEEDLLDLLPEYLRITARLLYEGYGQPEVAEKLGITPSGVSVRLKKIRKILNDEKQKEINLC